MTYDVRWFSPTKPEGDSFSKFEDVTTVSEINDGIRLYFAFPAVTRVEVVYNKDTIIHVANSSSEIITSASIDKLFKPAISQRSVLEI